MPKLSIITRAFNRLEYTVQCVSAVQLNTLGVDYEHLIINNGSTDGTKEWLIWIADMSNKWYSKVKVVHCNNQGDWGGMIYAIDHLSLDSEFVMQLDNDMVVPYNWAQICLEVMEKFPANVVVMKKVGFIKRFVANQIKKIDVLNGAFEAECGVIDTAVACWIAKTKTFKDIARGCDSCRSFTSSCKPIVKIFNLPCKSIEGHGLVEGYSGRYIQREKYLPADRRTRRTLKKRHKNLAKQWQEQQQKKKL
jgi:glycosyltransferase involved in cell wall biosynthesis